MTCGLTSPHKLQGEARKGQSAHNPSAEPWQLHAVVRWQGFHQLQAGSQSTDAK